MRRSCALLLTVCLLLTGCVSSKYKPAPKGTPPPVPMNLAAEQPPVTATLHTVIVFQGPGSWKKEAYWDEYIITASNTGAGPVIVESAALFDFLGFAQATGTKPWELDALGRNKARHLQRSDRRFLIGAGMGAAWVGSGALAVSAAFGGASAGLGAAGAATFVAIPVWVVGVGVTSLVLRHEIQKEFDRRRLPLPLTLAPGETRSGSLFFPLSPGPQRLVLRYRRDDAVEGVTLDLAPLTGLHLAPAAKK